MFDFVSKMDFFERKVNFALDGRTESSLSTVFLDLVSNVCNHNCIFCDGKFYDIEPKMFDLQQLNRMVDELVKLETDSVIIIGEGGESLLNPHFPFLAKQLKSVGIHLGLYTNGGILNNEILEALAGLDFVRVSLDAGSAKTHKLVHGCKNDDDFNKALGFIRKVKSLNGPEIGVSFIVLKENVQEISVAAAAAKSAGAAYLELKPAYLSDYTFNQDVFADVGPILQTEMEKCEALRDNGFRIVSNNQLRSRFAGGDEVSDLTRLISPRPCLTCRLRMVVSPTGCYLCTPHRSKEEYRIGDPMTESLVEIWNGPLRVSMADRLCMYKCAYYEQNELLLKLKEEGRAFNPEPSRSGIPLEQRYFL